MHHHGYHLLMDVKNLIDNFKTGGNYSLQLSFPTENKKIALSDTYSLSSYDILDIRNAVGADNVIITTKS